MAADVRSELQRRFGDRVVDSPRWEEEYSSDASDVPGRAVAVVRPRDEAELVTLVRWARSTRVGLVARGGGTSLDGESVPVHGSVVVDLAPWSQILSIDPVERLARVQPGVINRSLQNAASAHGLFFPPSPGSSGQSTIGGNAATNASGPRSFRYGPTRAWVRSARAVLGSGELVVLGDPTAKRSIGPDLLQMMIGSEGTLGIFTELTVKLAPVPARRTAVVVPLDRVSPGRAARSLAPDAPPGLCAVEFLDSLSAEALVRSTGARLPTGSGLLLLEIESASPEEEALRLVALQRRWEAMGCTVDPEVYPDAERLWAIRGASGSALGRALGARVGEDITVPLAQIDEYIAAGERIARGAGGRWSVFGHLGEGNLHPSVGIDPTTDAGAAVRAALLQQALILGGGISGEHGIGRVKREELRGVVGAEGLRLLRAVKQAFDPDGILNPGKILPDD